MGQVDRHPALVGGRLRARLLDAPDRLLAISVDLEVPLWDYPPTGNRLRDDVELRWAAETTSLDYRELRRAADRILRRKEQR